MDFSVDSDVCTRRSNCARHGISPTRIQWGRLWSRCACSPWLGDSNDTRMMAQFVFVGEIWPAVRRRVYKVVSYQIVFVSRAVESESLVFDSCLRLLFSEMNERVNAVDVSGTSKIDSTVRFRVENNLIRSGLRLA